MKFLSLEPFIPSGSNFEGSKQFFQELGFRINWEALGMVGFERDGCKFILQNYVNDNFAQNLMVSVNVSNVSEFRDEMMKKKLTHKFGIRIGEITQQSYGKEVNVIDIAGVCWHFIEN